VTPQRRPGDWGVQVGAFQRREQAEAKLSTLSRNLPSALLGARAQVVPVARNDGTWFRARFVGVAPGAAIEACREISRRGDNCMAVDPAA
jgi:cell division protein FtsN